MSGFRSEHRRSKLLLLVGLLASSTALQSCNSRSASPGSPRQTRTIGLQWTKAAADRVAGSGKPYALPQLRVYDAGGRLVFNLPFGASATTVGSQIDRALRVDRSVTGPTVAETLADLQTYDGHPASTVVTAPGRPLIMDYWATWCVPCKALEKALLAWSADKPAGSLQIVKAETDIMKAERAAGQRTFMMKKDASGKAHMVEVK